MQNIFKADSIEIKIEHVETPAVDPNMEDRYFVYTSQCHMPKINPFSADALKIYNPVNYTICDKSKKLITVNFNSKKKQYKLHMNIKTISCCYQSIKRSGRGRSADRKYSLSPCRNISQDFVVPHHVKEIITICKTKNSRKVLKEAFTFVHPPKKMKNQKHRKPSILLWGIDSLSRINFRRTMPLTYKYLQEQSWYELQGYNKIHYNTFPNLMALLSGYNYSLIDKYCHPQIVGGLNDCPLLWKNYSKHGYKTAYAEDWTYYATFNYLIPGFLKPPTDYYLRPFMLAIEKILSGNGNCRGRRLMAEYVYDYAVQFTNLLRSQPTFGLFWTNSFSHSLFFLPSSMDKKMVKYMHTLKKNGIMDNSIIFFLSDHGMRFGPLRQLKSGFVEERLPNMFIWLPKWFRQQYPSFELALKLNRNRLSSPYDIYATLHHILQLKTSTNHLPRASSCPKCRSVFFEIPENRTCADAGITPHWCTCNVFENISTADRVVKIIISKLIKATNSYLSARHLSHRCSKLKLSQIISAKTKNDPEGKQQIFRLRYETKPKKSLFAATVRWNKKTGGIPINIDDISRLNKYQTTSNCIKDKTAMKYCICTH
ncbi:uncharacterized protein LOC115628976 [Scaptodrosophila lebanonensis]|uniref:Uncharacterized protein LOC115628976 n=1 Tax=Drosophila lebanonensis TaxID=7225 RepID=A0A6J2TZM8_DROLE|nr:uncharacterized protein LOC115628976 [Scaptodrosophila lebanonensis]